MVMNVRLPVQVSFSVRQLTCLNSNITTSLLILLKFVELSLLESFAGLRSFLKNLSVQGQAQHFLYPVQTKHWLISLPVPVCITKLSIAANIASCTLVPTANIALPSSLRTLSAVSLSSVFIST